MPGTLYVFMIGRIASSVARQSRLSMSSALATAHVPRIDTAMVAGAIDLAAREFLMAIHLLIFWLWLRRISLRPAMSWDLRQGSAFDLPRGIVSRSSTTEGEGASQV